MIKIEAGEGISVIDIPEANLSVLCACPENAVKFLYKKGLIRVETKGGVRSETGPNAILLSETPIQNGRFSNLAEFPVLQMLYRQGLIIPGHPNNTGMRPMLIGLRGQVEAQARYIYAGSYGITSPGELEPDDPAMAKAVIRMKKRFAFGEFRSTDGLLDVRVIDGSIIELRSGVFLRRLAVNRYEFIHGGKALSVDLNLASGASYAAPYTLPRSKAAHDRFTIVHIGEGDGWDVDRPCMGSVVIYEGKPYLVDAGPNIEESLDAVGLSVGDLAGVFHTHVHDDHFVGLTYLMRSGRRLAYYAVPMVRRSAAGKLHALCGIGEREFGRLFDVRDLETGRWNDVDGLGVMPVFSPHPVETTLFRFRATGPNGPRTYAHFADLSSFKVLDSMVTEDDGSPGISAADAARAKAAYLEPADIKKVDVGGGMIHGEVDDFSSDSSLCLLFSHGDSANAMPVRSFGRVAGFGERDVLIPASGDWGRSAALAAFGSCFPGLPEDAFGDLASSPRRVFRAGEAVAAMDSVVVTLDGAVEMLGPGGEVLASFDSSAMIGAVEAAAGNSSAGRYRARLETEALVVPAEDFRRFVARNALGDLLLQAGDGLADLAGSGIFAGIRSFPCLFRAAGASSLVAMADGESLDPMDGSRLYVLVSGKAVVSCGDAVIEELGPGGVFGDEAIVYGAGRLFSARCVGAVSSRSIPSPAIEGSPALLWGLRECFERRLAIVEASFDFKWRPEYAMGVPSIDAQHRGIFESIDGMVTESAKDVDRALERLLGLLEEHFAIEEAMQASAGYPRHGEHSREHRLLLGELLDFATRTRAGMRASELSGFMKDCFIRHTLLMDRDYLPWIS